MAAVASAAQSASGDVAGVLSQENFSSPLSIRRTLSADAVCLAVALENSPGAPSAQRCIKLSITVANPLADTLAMPVPITRAITLAVPGVHTLALKTIRPRAIPGAHNLAILLAIPTTFAVA